MQKDKNRFAGLFNISLYSLFFKTGEEGRCDKDEIVRLPRPPIIPLGRRFSPALDWWHHQPPTQALIPTQPLHPLSLNPTPSSPSSATAKSSQSIAHPLDLPQSSQTTNTVFTEYSFLNTFVSCCSIYVSFDRSLILTHPMRVRRCFYSFSSLLRPPITLITAPLPPYLMISHWSKLSEMKMRM